MCSSSDDTISLLSESSKVPLRDDRPRATAGFVKQSVLRLMGNRCLALSQGRTPRSDGVQHEQLYWRESGNDTGSWEVLVRCDLLGFVKVDIPSRNPEGLTPTQERCLQLVRSLKADQKPALTDSLRRYAAVFFDSASDEDDLSFSSEFAAVPYLEHAETPYVFLYADSPVDDEHGVCFLIRDGEVLCCCHGDQMLEFVGWDNTDALDSLAEELN